MFILLEETSPGRFLNNSEFITITFVCFMLSNYKGKKDIRYNLQLKLTTEITKSTRTLVRLLTILDAFSSNFVKRGTCLFILYKNMSDI